MAYVWVLLTQQPDRRADHRRPSTAKVVGITANGEIVLPPVPSRLPLVSPAMQLKCFKQRIAKAFNTDGMAVECGRTIAAAVVCIASDFSAILRYGSRCFKPAARVVPTNAARAYSSRNTEMSLMREYKVLLCEDCEKVS